MTLVHASPARLCRQGGASQAAVSRPDAPADRRRDGAGPAPLGRSLHSLVDHIFLALVLLSAGCFSVLATLPLFLLGLAMAAYLAFKLTAPDDALESTDGGPDGREG